MNIIYDRENNTMKLIGDISNTTFFKIGYYFGMKNQEWGDLYANTITINNYNMTDLFEFVEFIGYSEFDVKVL